MINVISFQIADSIQIRKVKSHLVGKLKYEDSDELFYEEEGNKFVYIFKYGVVCFLGYSAIEIPAYLAEIEQFAVNPFDEKFSEEFEVAANHDRDIFGYNKVYLAEPTSEALQIVMLSVSQSVALDYYISLSNLLLEETKQYTISLEQKGSLSISGKALSKVIGKTLNLKNRISENLYIFDAPTVTWEDERLNKLHAGLKNTFDLNIRYRNVVEELAIVKDNLDLFKDLMHHKKSSMLEWIIIILILVEVVNLFFEKLL